MTSKSSSSSHSALRWIAIVMFGGMVSILVFAFGSSSVSEGLGYASTAMCIAGASALVGAFVGFLFGIPRSLSRKELATDLAEATGESIGENGGLHGPGYKANTNLEEISDWLTKILVGVGLTQLSGVSGNISSLARFLSPGLGDTERAVVMAAVTVSYFSVSGFLFSYLWTRLFLAGALREADVSALGARVTDLKNQLESQAKADAKALSLAQQILNPRLESPAINEKILEEAILEASAPAKTTIFYQASDVRSRHWKKSSEKIMMERTIPIFRALIKDDARDEYHKNHGQLGFALKDKVNPDWKGAERELSEAIRIRGESKSNGWQIYEFNRAICRIQMMDEQQVLDPDLIRNISEDLRVAETAHDLLKKIQAEPVIANWRKKIQPGY